MNKAKALGGGLALEPGYQKIGAGLVLLVCWVLAIALVVRLLQRRNTCSRGKDTVAHIRVQAV